MVEDIIYIYIYKELICYILTKTWEHISIYTERMIGRRSVLNGNLNIIWGCNIGENETNISL